MASSSLLYYYAFSRTGKVGPRHFSRLLELFGSAEEAWKADQRQLREVGLTARVIEAISQVKREVDLEKELGELEAQGVRLITPEDEGYPSSLKEIEDTPFLLYLLGEITRQDSRAVAVVGARKQSRYGEEVIEDFVPALVAQGFTIVSGLALGNDSKAHQEALSAGGRTVGVLGSGILNIYPVRSRRLAERIVSSSAGAVISEFPPRMQPFPYNFPVRNRIISGLSQAVIIVEAEAKSGTLLTARHAAEQGKEVLAVPGDIRRPLSRGPHRLIQLGARLVQSVEDVFEALQVDRLPPEAAKPPVTPESPEEEQILSVLEKGPLHIDELSRRVSLEAAKVFSTVSLMELKGMVVDDGGGVYRLRR